MNNLKFIEATNGGHPWPTVSAAIALSRELGAVADPFFAVPDAGEASSIAVDRVDERKQK
jgi:hypothetical protein